MGKINTVQFNQTNISFPELKSEHAKFIMQHQNIPITPNTIKSPYQLMLDEMENFRKHTDQRTRFAA